MRIAVHRCSMMIEGKDPKAANHANALEQRVTEDAYLEGAGREGRMFDPSSHVERRQALQGA